MKIENRFLKYISFNTQSDPYSTTSPSSKNQLELAEFLIEEMRILGLENVHMSEFGVIYGTIPSNNNHQGDVIGLIAHMDTSPDASGENVHPQIIRNYDGSRISLNEDMVLDPQEFPDLNEVIGHDIITTDGTTLLGADDKAGIAIIMSLAEYMYKHPEFKHNDIQIAFTPDEEIGMGTEHFDVERFGADYAYTVDGNTEGEIQYENFNAAKAEYVVKGFNVHPGSSKDTMINASLVAMEINNCLPAMEIPRETENYEGFYHLISMSGDVAEAHLNYIIRDHDASLFEAKKATLCHIEKIMNEKWGAGTVQLTITDQYRNMAEIIKKCMFLIENAVKACKNTNIPPLILPIRGGTDGCMLSYMGLPCPNLGTGGHAYHGPYEHITIEGMDKTVDMLVELVKTFSKPIIN